MLRSFLLVALVFNGFGIIFSQPNDNLTKIDSYLTGLSKEKNFSGGLLIVKGGKTIFSKGYGQANRSQKNPFTPATLACMGSITKAFTAAGILKLYQQTRLKLNDPLKKFFPSVPSDKANITIHQLLVHSAGFHEFLSGDGGDYEKVETNEFLKRAFAEPLAFEPGTKAVYTNVGMSILGIIIEKVSGLSYETFLAKELFQPLGIKSIGYHYPPIDSNRIAHGYQNGKDWGTLQSHFRKAGGGPYWNLKANGGLQASLDDMALWANGLTNSTVLPDSLISKMFSPHIAESGYGGNSHFGYGCNIQKSRRGTKMIDNGGSNGVYFARLLRLPEEGIVIYMVTNENTINTNSVMPNISQLFWDGKITNDALATKFMDPFLNKLYELVCTDPSKFDQNLKSQNIAIEDDMQLLEVGQKLNEEGKFNEALALYKYYTHTFPQIVVAWNDLGDVYRSMGNKPEARRCYEQALKLRPGNPRATENLKSL